MSAVTSPTANESSEVPSSLRPILMVLLLVRAVLAIVLGVILLVTPAAGGAAVAWVVVITVGVWLMLDGITSIATGVSERRHKLPGAWWTVFGGVVALIAGLGALIFPLSTAAFGGLLLLWFAAIGLIVRGVLELLDRRLGGWVRLLGVLNIVFGIVLAIVLFSNPGAALLALIWMIAWYGIIFGLVGIASALLVVRASRATAAEPTPAQD